VQAANAKHVVIGTFLTSFASIHVLKVGILGAAIVLVVSHVAEVLSLGEGPVLVEVLTQSIEIAIRTA